MRILVIIVAYNFERWIERCLGSLRTSGVQVDTVVIDNGSKDNTTEIIERDYPEVRLVKSEHNLGFGRANNIGLKMACEEGYDAVYLLNQDAWVEKDTIGTLAELSNRFHEYGILSPVHLDSEGRLDGGFADYAKKNNVDDIKRLAANGEDVVNIPFVNAAHWFIPVAVVRRVGGFSPLFFLYGEDVDWCNRLKKCGFLIGYSPSAFAVHDRGKREKPSPASIYRANYVYLLSEYANVNRSFPTAFAYSVMASIKSMMKAVAHGDWHTAGMYARIFAQLCSKTGDVIRTRRDNSGCGTKHIIYNNV